MKLRRSPAALVLMGMGVLVLQQLSDWVVGTELRGNSPVDQLAQFTRSEGKIYSAVSALAANVAVYCKADEASPSPDGSDRNPVDIQSVHWAAKQ